MDRAIRFAITTHEILQKQKRKGKDIPYITHPLTVGLILARAGADEDAVVAGILHDTIEDSIPEQKVSREMIAQKFGDKVADIVASVSEPNKNLPWGERKKEALVKIRTFSHESLLVKSADIISNTTELIGDYEQDGDEVFTRFGAPKHNLLQHYLRVITAIVEQWSDNPLADDLRHRSRKLQSMGAWDFNPKLMEYADYSENMQLHCPACDWEGTPKSGGWIGYYDDLLDVSCPNCETMLLVVGYPLIKNL